jgi:3-oxoacyl-[acyl-carrier protein] reductase
VGQLTGQTAIVTGAAVGIGREIAVAYGRAGAKVVVNYSKSEREAEETAELVGKVDGESLLVKADVAQDDQVRAMIRQTLERFGRIDVLVNNAGVAPLVPFSDLEGLTAEAWDRTFEINVKGTFLCSRAVVAPMRRQGKGCIINIASTGGIRPRASSLAYGASKAAVIHLTQCLANTLGPEIRVNAIAPGLTRGTRIQEGRPNLEEVLSRRAQTNPLKRVGVVEDTAEVALFLATGAGFMTGSILVVDGGGQLGSPNV